MKKRLKNILITLMMVLLSVGFFSVAADAKERYITAILYNFSNGTIDYMVFENKGDFPYEIMANYTNGVKFTAHEIDGVTLKGVGGFTDIDGTVIAGGTNEHGIITRTIFPGRPIGSETSISYIDKDRADEVYGTLITGLNQSINFVRNQASNGSAKNYDIEDIATFIGDAVRTKSAELGNGISGISLSYSDENDYEVTFSSGNTEEKITALYRMQKYESDPDLGYLDWPTIIAYANGALESGFVADNNGWQEFYKEGTLASLLSDFSETIGNWTARQLGFNTIEELIFNRGARKTSYYLGIMPYTWWEVANSLFWIFEVVGVIILISSILYMVYKQNYAIISPVVRVTLQDQIANLAIAIFLMVAYIPIFYIFAKTNNILCDVLDKMSGTRTLLGSFNSGWFIKLIMTFVNLAIVIRINITYLTRAVTVTALHIISPAVIASMALGGGTKGSLFNTWLRELISAIFMQSFDAIILALFVTISAYGTRQNAWEGQLLMFMFIPLNQWFKEKLTGTSGIAGVAKSVGDQGSSAVAQMASIPAGLIGVRNNAESALAKSSSKKGEGSRKDTVVKEDSKNNNSQGDLNSGDKTKISSGGGSGNKQLDTGDGAEMVNTGATVAKETAKEDDKNSKNEKEKRPYKGSRAQTYVRATVGGLGVVAGGMIGGDTGRQIQSFGQSFSQNNNASSYSSGQQDTYENDTDAKTKAINIAEQKRKENDNTEPEITLTTEQQEDLDAMKSNIENGINPFRHRKYEEEMEETDQILKEINGEE